MLEARPMVARSLSLRHRLWIGMGIMVGFSLTFFWLGQMPLIESQTLRWTYLPSALLVGWLISHWIEVPLKQSLMTLTMGMYGYQDGDFSFRLAPLPQPEMADLVDRFNHLGEILRQERATIYQKELLLDTVIQSAPMAILLVGGHDRIILANAEAREMFLLGKPLIGLAFADLKAVAPEPLREALIRNQSLIEIESEGDREVFYLSRRRFHLHGITHNLILIKRLTREMRRQEVVTWKKLIRLINHELNNALAPLQSLLNSSRKILQDAPQYQRVAPLFSTMQSTIQHLVHFLQHYANFARLPMPQPHEQPWQDFLAALQILIPFNLKNELVKSSGFFDAGQLQQVLLNIIKNAREASPEGQAVVLRLRNTVDGGTSIQVLDRGKGMQPDQMEKALLPFYSTKHGGTGLGLALSREILEAHDGSIQLELRDGGGIAVTCVLPPKNDDPLNHTESHPSPGASFS